MTAIRHLFILNHTSFLYVFEALSSFDLLTEKMCARRLVSGRKTLAEATNAMKPILY